MLIPLLLAACGPKAPVETAAPRPSRREARQPVTIAPPTVPDLSGSGAPPPDLQAGSNLEMTSLTWSYVKFTIAADTSGLSTIDDAHALAIQRHLSADPRWKVHKRNGVITAEQRTSVADGWRLLPSGYHEDAERMWRVAVRFDERGPGDPWADAGLISESTAGDAEIKVDGIPLSGEQRGRMATAIVVEAPSLAVEIFESGPETDRSITAEALGTVPVVLPGVLPDRVTARGFDPAWLSAQHTHSGEPTAALHTLSPGHIEVTAWLNPQQPGWTWLRLLDERGQPWPDDVVPAWTAERIGWGGEDLFYFQGIAPVPEDRTPTTAQLWHLADGAEEPVKLMEWAP